MKHINNVVFSTTRQWNPGDEFILIGCINILQGIFGNFNAIIYNRNPEIRQKYTYKNFLRNKFLTNKSFIKKELLESFFRTSFYDNSLKNYHNCNYIDLVVFAGTPSWKGLRSLNLYKIIEKFNLPTIYIGIGTDKQFTLKDISKKYRKIIEKSRLITTRDSSTFEALSQIGAKYLPCPSILASPITKKIKNVEKIGLIFGTKNAPKNNNLNEQFYHKLINFYKIFLSQYNCEFICHYIDELEDVSTNFPDVIFNYSFDSKDYLNIYKKFDLIIGHRIHAMGIAASLGIPGILIKYDNRADTAKGFLSHIISIDEDFENISKLIKNITDNVEDISLKIQEIKVNTYLEYIKLISEAFQ